MKKIVGLIFTLFLLFPQVVVHANETEQEIDAKSSEINYGMEFVVTRNAEVSSLQEGWGIQGMRVTEDVIEFDVDMSDEFYKYCQPKEIQTLTSGPGGQYQVNGKRILREIKNGRRYYTMRFDRNQYINGSNTVIYIKTVVDSQFVYNELIISLDTKIPINYNDILVSIQSKIDPWKVVDWYQERNTAISFNNDGNSNQKWYLHYNEAKNAYSIHSYKSLAYSLIENANGTVGVKPNVSDSDSALWQLIWEGFHENGSAYYLKNLKSGKVMDVEANQLDGGNIITFNQRETENQKFILHIEGRK
ncbi:RICIN domain-containing protein [Candidatus Enterococcus courvalinii]|uniref:Ricin-type beta-trefoil lectin domain protein n=1 Tax=Candidatus Enterococcus courvalinii TaxID=2815329 RepID=A0ABS3HZZ0_9ENTE|nr:RICIN domain-containing protein [Enterococcus sp. MSG2901]MBO0482036.1 ricin-type beta-trefoil lectin domain protein [Enterococcus sp. MSG2901]